MIKMVHITYTKMHQVTKTSSKYKIKKMIKMAHITYTKMHQITKTSSKYKKRK